jgi:hypothetical protein
MERRRAVDIRTASDEHTPSVATPPDAGCVAGAPSMLAGLCPPVTRYFAPVVPRQPLIVLLALGMLVPTACGGGDDASSVGPRRLSIDDQSRVSESRLAIRSYCRRIALYLAGKEGRPTTADTRQAYAAVDSLISIARENPEAQNRNGDTMRQVVGDTAEDLEGTNCSADLVARLERGLASLPGP